MKQLLLMLAMLGMAAFPGYAKDVLSEITADRGISSSAFLYNEDGKMIRQDDVDDYGKYYSLFTYNELGQLVRNDTYQYDVITPGRYELVNYVDYQYDAEGRLCQRENYNYDVWSGSGGYVKGGRITYAYNEQGKLSQMLVYMLWKGEEMILQKGDYSYNDRGLCAEEIYWQVDFSDLSTFLPTLKIAYVYNERDRIVEKNSYSYPTDRISPAEPELQTVNAYDYEEGVGLVKYEQRNKNGNVIHRKLYSFSTEAAGETIYPYDIESADNNFLYENVQRRIAKCTEFATDLNSGQLVLYDEYTYHYLPKEQGIPAVSQPPTAIFVTYEGGTPVLGGLRVGDVVNIVNAEGRCVAAVTAAGARLAVPDLLSGTYIAVSQSGAVKFIVK